MTKILDKLFTEKQKEELAGRLLSFLSRKFILSFLVLLLSTYMVSKGELEARYWLGIVASDIVGYNFSNSFSKKHN